MLALSLSGFYLGLTMTSNNEGPSPTTSVLNALLVPVVVYMLATVGVLLAGWRLKHRPKRVAVVLASLARGMVSASPRTKVEIFVRAARFGDLTGSATLGPPSTLGLHPRGDAVLAEMAVWAFQAAGDLQDRAMVVAAAAVAGGAAYQCLGAELRNVEPAECEELLQAAAAIPRLARPDLLLGFCARVADVSFHPDATATLCGMAAPVPHHLLKGFSSSQLARIALASLRQSPARPATSFPSALLAGRDFGKHALAAFDWRPLLNPVDLLLLVCLTIPVLGVCLVVLAGMAAAIALSYGIVLVANREHDPYQIRTRGSGTLPPSLSVDRFNALLKSRQERLIPGTGWLERRRLIRTVLAYQILSGGSFEQVDPESCPPRLLARVIRRLRRRGVLPRRAGMVVSTMGNRALLDAVVSAGRAHEAGPLDPVPAPPQDHLERTMPTAVWPSFLPMALVAAGATALWWQALLWLGVPLDLKIRPYFRLDVLLAASVLLTAMQHWFRRAIVGRLAPFKTLAYFGVLLFVAIKCRSLPLAPLLLSNLIAPEFLTRWRAANLLFPSSAELWTQRLLSVTALVLSCALLAAVTPLLAVPWVVVVILVPSYVVVMTAVVKLGSGR